jgi:hypothetical protein
MLRSRPPTPTSSGNFDGSSLRSLEHDLEEEKPDFPQDHGSTEMLESEPIRSGAMAL